MRLNLLLLAALLASSLALVHTAYESRRLFSGLDRERARAQALHAEHQRLQAERQIQATPARVERLARVRLGMRMATPAVIEYVVDPVASSGQGASR
jgi:cell division protein FtsL